MPTVSACLLLCLLPAMVAAQCVHEGRVIPKNGLVPSANGDGCFDRVCRCESWDRCRFELERKYVLARVNEKRKQTGDEVAKTQVRTLECKCVEDPDGSSEMNFYCAGGRGDNQNGCLDAKGALLPAGHRVSVETSGGDQLVCECDASGHYINCAGQDDLSQDQSCQDASGRRVQLGETYNRLVQLHDGGSVSLQCICAKSSQETACVRLG